RIPRPWRYPRPRTGPAARGRQAAYGPWRGLSHRRCAAAQRPPGQSPSSRPSQVPGSQRVRDHCSSADLQRTDKAVAGEAEPVSQVRRTAIECARDRRDDDGPIILDAAFERFCRDAILRARLILPSADCIRAHDIAAFVLHSSVRCEAGHHRIDVMTVLRREVAVEDIRQGRFHLRLAFWGSAALLICCYTALMARTDKKVEYSPTGKLEDVTPGMAASGVETAFRMLEGRWKMVIIFHLFDRSVLRFSELER